MANIATITTTTPTSWLSSPSQSSSPSTATAWMSSWWDRLFVPGDLRARREQIEAARKRELEILAEQQELEKVSRPPRRFVDEATRSRRKNGLLIGGTVFTMLSLIVTRRSLTRKRQLTYPHTFTPSNATPPRVDGGLEAAEALGLASMNVFSFAMIAVGAAMTYFDIADVEELREGMKKAIGEDVFAGESKADKEIEGWVAEVLSRKDVDGKYMREGVAEKIVEIERLKREKEKLEGKR